MLLAEVLERVLDEGLFGEDGCCRILLILLLSFLIWLALLLLLLWLDDCDGGCSELGADFLSGQE